MMYFFQVVNGLMEREDWEMAIKVPIGMLPTGSGNALVRSLNSSQIRVRYRYMYMHMHVHNDYCIHVHAVYIQYTLIVTVW